MKDSVAAFVPFPCSYDNKAMHPVGDAAAQFGPIPTAVETLTDGHYGTVEGTISTSTHTNNNNNTPSLGRREPTQK
ncbi:hypothetical protein AK830_g5340 [Neonectria ditissima]|uniref:Uncharacterized protein n=1 Tax=Neonectria ditissima TaxID=78410 RepID=A0A0P7BKZ9_9HYPO|nr:hypothetical protein AK830_g5340 [Neonectria ditissima]